MAYVTLYHESSDFSTPEYVEKNTFYENRETVYRNHYLAVIDLIVFNDYGELLIQKRSRRKKKSPSLFHTTVGGHVDPQENPDLTLIHECMEEIGVPCILTPPNTDYNAFISRIRDYTDRFVAAKHYKIYKRTFTPYTTPDDRTDYIKDYAAVYFGLYNWPIQNLDRSVDWFEYFSLESLFEDTEKAPHLFTEVFLSYAQELQEDFYSFVSQYCREKS